MTIERAATHLGVSARTVRKYIAREELCPLRRAGDRRKYLDATSVDELRAQRESAARTTAELRVEVRELRAGMRRMRSDLDAVLHILDLRERPLALTAESASVLWTMVEDEAKNDSWATAELLEWADIFARLREEDMLAMRTAIKTATWKPFLELNARMIATAHDSDSFATDTSVQLVHQHLCEGRRRLRVAVACDAELQGKNDGGNTFLLGDRLETLAKKRALKGA